MLFPSRGWGMIKDESLSPDRVLGYLIFYEKSRTFYIELPDDADPWETPLLLSSFLDRGEHSIGSYWSHMWVQQRIVPPERQNIGQILKAARLSEYNEFALLLLNMGRCAQDDCYLEEISADDLPDELLKRWQEKVEDVVPVSGRRLLVFFRNGEVKVYEALRLAEKMMAFIPILASDDMFNRVEVQPDGYGVMWGERLTVSDHTLYQEGSPVPLSRGAGEGPAPGGYPLR